MPDVSPLDAPPPDLLPAVQARLELLVRKLDLVERRVAHREKVLAELKTNVAPVVAAGDVLTADFERLDDFDHRLGRLERRGFGPTPGGAALDFPRFDPQEARPGDTIQLTVRLEGFRKGDKLEFTLTDVMTDATLPPLAVEIPDEAPVGLAVPWKVPAGVAGRAGAYRFTVRGRECESRSPVLTVRA